MAGLRHRRATPSRESSGNGSDSVWEREINNPFIPSSMHASSHAHPLPRQAYLSFTNTALWQGKLSQGLVHSPSFFMLYWHNDFFKVRGNANLSCILVRPKRTTYMYHKTRLDPSRVTKCSFWRVNEFSIFNPASWVTQSGCGCFQGGCFTGILVPSCCRFGSSLWQCELWWS